MEAHSGGDGAGAGSCSSECTVQKKICHMVNKLFKKKKSQTLQVHDLKEILINVSREISVREKKWNYKVFVLVS